MSIKLAVSLIVKNEGPYIYEWLSFHDVVGVDHFFIYDNGSDDNTINEIKRWPKQDKVTIIDWPDRPGQISSYWNTVKNHSSGYDWCAFIDCDEFLFAKDGRDLKSTIEEIAQSQDAGAIYVHWSVFGSNGHAEPPQGKVIEDFTKRSKLNFGANRMGKTIARPGQIEHMINVHFIGTRDPLVNEAGVHIDSASCVPPEVPSFDKIVINHYYTKSREEWRVKRLRGRVGIDPNSPDHIRADESFAYHDRNEVEDRSALEFLDEINRRFY